MENNRKTTILDTLATFFYMLAIFDIVIVSATQTTDINSIIKFGLLGTIHILTAIYFQLSYRK